MVSYAKHKDEESFRAELERIQKKIGLDREIHRQIQLHLSKILIGNICDSIFYAVDKEDDPKLEAYIPFRAFSRYLMAKNINLFESCLVLLENNMEQEAYILARSQFNNTLWISYLCDDHNNERTKEYYYEYHISKLLQFRNIQKYVSENEEKIKNSGAEIIEESEIEGKQR